MLQTKSMNEIWLDRENPEHIAGYQWKTGIGDS